VIAPSETYHTLEDVIVVQFELSVALWTNI